jgi:hypothetical protein
MMIALLAMIGSVGASRQTSQPKIAAQRIAQYCRGASTAARGERQRPNDENRAGHRDDPNQEHEADIEKR